MVGRPGRGVTCASQGEDGDSPVTAVFGVAIFLVFLLLSAQVLLHLYASSVVGAAAFDAAALAAGRDSGDPRSAGARLAAEQRADQLLGGLAAGPDGATYVWQVTERLGGSAEVALTVRVASPSIAVRGAGLGDVVRTVRVAVEEVGP
jgi:hypothetical protein